MRTVDPEIWSKKLKKRNIVVSRCNKFGQQRRNIYETVFRASLVDAALEYWENCSLPAAKYINMEKASKVERYCYIFLLFLSVGLGIFVVSYESHRFYMTPPLVVNSQAAKVFITEISFPAVALCSNNIISKKAVANYTEYLFNHPMNGKRRYRYNRSEIEKNLCNLGALLNVALPPVQPKFDEFLHEVNPQFNVTDIMFEFTPRCSSLLARCSWRGRLVACNLLFAARVTPLGFCCVFNSRYYPVDANNTPRVLDMIGQNYGLGVVITENSDDFMYVRRNADGVEMLLFEGSEYPLLESGDVRLYPIPRNQSVYVNIRSLTQHADDDIAYYSEEWRGCRSSGRGQSRCLARCRRGGAAALCGCAPYSLLADVAADRRRVCGLRDLPCLYKHRDKLASLYPRGAAGAAGEAARGEAAQGALECGACLALCRRQLYFADLSYIKYSHKTNTFRNFLTEGQSLVNSSTVRLFYNLEHQYQYTLESYMRWYEVLVKLSTQWAILASVSVLCVVELVYHATFRVAHHFVKRMRLANMKSPATSM